MSVSQKRVVLCILDGWGMGDDSYPYNAISKARTPHWDRLLKHFPWSTLDASQRAVGLPHGQMGNSEVGHMTLGLGRVIEQDLVRLSELLASPSHLDQEKVWEKYIINIKASKRPCHIMGLLSDGGVHALSDHFLKFITILDAWGIPTYIHAFLDGRDTPPKSSETYLTQLQKTLKNTRHATLATLMGRFYAMDRDQRWQRTQEAFQCIIEAKSAHTFNDCLSYLHEEYKQGRNDEFIKPAHHPEYKGVHAGDHLLMVNFRKDRVRQLLHSFFNPDFHGFERDIPPFDKALGMVEYDPSLHSSMDILMNKPPVEGSLGEVVSTHGLSQLRVAETEKYAHVTYFLNGGIETVFDKEERFLVPSPNVSTYDQAPEMAAKEVCQKVCMAVESTQYAFIAVNFANADMVGHTAHFDASIKAVECLDQCLGAIQKVCEKNDTVLIVTADHGNVEYLYDDIKKRPHTAHTTNPVPFVLVGGEKYGVKNLQSGGLKDVAPTILSLLDLPIPSLMTGKNLCTS
jgi:2,3-bisphosphoglycerate-independent phosphoglycerate mutase